MNPRGVARGVDRGVSQDVSVAGGGGGGPFDPKDIVGCVACWVADDLALADGAAVASWVDRKSSLSLAQATGAKQPLYRAAGIGGQPAVDFDGVNDLLAYEAAGAVSTALSGHVIVVTRITAINNGIPWCSSDEASGTRYLLALFQSSNNSQGIYQDNNDTGDIVVTGASTFATATDYLYEVHSSGTAYDVRRNGTSLSVSAAGGSNLGDWFGDTSARDNFTLGAQKYTTEGSFYSGKIAAVIVIDGDMSAGDRTALNAWVSTKYGITIA